MALVPGLALATTSGIAQAAIQEHDVSQHQMVMAIAANHAGIGDTVRFELMQGKKDQWEIVKIEGK